MKNKMIGSLILIMLFQFSNLSSQTNRAQCPPFLANFFFDINIGYINYPFSVEQLEPGYNVEEILVPHTAVRISQGNNINEFLAAQIIYMRPILWVRYKNVNGDNRNHPVFMNVAGVSLKGQVPIHGKLRIYGEGGLGIITRSGFHATNEPDQIIVKDAVYASILVGAGLSYQANDKWGFMISTSYSPANSKTKQPYTVFYSGGFSINMNPLSQEKVEAKSNNGYIFPHNMIQIGYTTNAFGYGVNNFVAEGKIPIFWGGKADVKSGISIHYQRNAFRGRKVFSLDLGVSFSHYTSNLNNDKFWALSVFPVFRFTVLHLKPFDFYLNYSLAGPTYFSRLTVDDLETGPKFTFQDFMGAGFYFGKDRKLNAEIRIAHYSNGNLFADNPGVKIPLTFNLGYTF